MKQDKEKPEANSQAETPQEKLTVTDKVRANRQETSEQKISEQKPDKEKGAEQEAPEETPETSLKAVIAKQAIEEEMSGSASFTLRKILGGDILTAQIIRKQIWLFILIVFFVIIYISNRYSIQKDLIELDQLQKELQDTKYKALSTSSQITEKSRESNVLEVLQHSKDSILHIATQPPYIINVPEE